MLQILFQLRAERFAALQLLFNKHQRFVYRSGQQRRHCDLAPCTALRTAQHGNRVVHQLLERRRQLNILHGAALQKAHQLLPFAAAVHCVEKAAYLLNKPVAPLAVLLQTVGCVRQSAADRIRGIVDIDNIQLFSQPACEA